MSGQSVKITIRSSDKPYSFKDLVKTIGPNNEWAIFDFSSVTDRKDKDLNSYATLYREDTTPVTLGQFCQQTGLDKEVIQRFDIV